MIDIGTGVRGSGDWNVLGEVGCHALTTVKMLFVQLSDWVAAEPDLELAVDPDPGLA
ncbi:MAG: hypothetical protein WBD41_00690 [Rhodococcus sp. (in: high G+C Gram-positive bacteria)]|uniref:hypothetical protein n=1 Tax=Rhodococcus sp. EPR-157 TaxID=1813677 RepID=UPI000A7B7E45|nr:hypothetical protein [Rhodococcus sp. EPR-157]